MQLKEKLDINPILICLGNILQEAKASHLGRTNKAFCKLLMIMMITTKDKRGLLSYFSCFHYGYTPNCEMSCMSLNLEVELVSTIRVRTNIHHRFDSKKYMQ